MIRSGWPILVNEFEIMFDCCCLNGMKRSSRAKVSGIGWKRWRSIGSTGSSSCTAATSAPRWTSLSRRCCLHPAWAVSAAAAEAAEETIQPPPAPPAGSSCRPASVTLTACLCRARDRSCAIWSRRVLLLLSAKVQQLWTASPMRWRWRRRS